MSESTLLTLVALELLGLVGYFVWTRWRSARRAANKPRLPRPLRLFVALLGLGVFVVGPGVLILHGNPIAQSKESHKRLVEKGLPGTAVVTHISETGTFYNRRPEVEVWMTVTQANGLSFTSQDTRIFSVSDVQNYRPGANVKVFYDPKATGSVAIVGLLPGSQ